MPSLKYKTIKNNKIIINILVNSFNGLEVHSRKTTNQNWSRNKNWSSIKNDLKDPNETINVKKITLKNTKHMFVIFEIYNVTFLCYDKASILKCSLLYIEIFN